MAYILNNDTNENFECVLSLEGANFKDSFARLIIESNGYNLMFTGVISESGKCKVSIPKLNRLFPNETTGKMMLEVVADDTYFQPWSDTVKIIPSRKLTVESVNVKVKPDLDKLCESLRQNGFTKKVIKENKQAIPILGKVIHEYYKSLSTKPQKGVMKEILRKL